MPTKYTGSTLSVHLVVVVTLPYQGKVAFGNNGYKLWFSMNTLMSPESETTWIIFHISFNPDSMMSYFTNFCMKQTFLYEATLWNIHTAIFGKRVIRGLSVHLLHGALWDLQNLSLALAQKSWTFLGNNSSAHEHSERHNWKCFFFSLQQGSTTIFLKGQIVNMFSLWAVQSCHN